MGNCCAVSKVFYTDVDSEDELNIRKFEETNIGAFKMTFNSFLHKLSLQSNFESSSKVENLIKELFGEECVKLIKDNKIFKTGDLYSVSKIKALAFLITRSELIVSDQAKYYDKSSYLIQEILINEEENLNQAIDVHNPRLNEILSVMIEVALDGLSRFYLEQNKITSCKYCEEIFKLKKNLIAEYIIKNVTKKSDNSRTEESMFSFKDLNMKFKSDNWFLTAGYIREIAFILVNENSK